MSNEKLPPPALDADETTPALALPVPARKKLMKSQSDPFTERHSKESAMNSDQQDMDQIQVRFSQNAPQEDSVPSWYRARSGSSENMSGNYRERSGSNGKKSPPNFLKGFFGGGSRDQPSLSRTYSDGSQDSDRNGARGESTPGGNSPFMGSLWRLIRRGKEDRTGKDTDADEYDDDCGMTIQRMTSGEFQDRYLEVFGGSSTPAMVAHQHQLDQSNRFGMPKGEPTEEDKKLKSKKGSFSGVFVPTCENMWGVLIFLRFYQIVGHAGVGLALFIVFLSFCAAFCTTISLSATVASGGVVAGGGPYHIISRAVGPYVGGAIGLTYFLGITCLAVLECLGAVESFVVAYPDMKIGGAGGDVVNSLRAYGSVLVATLLMVVYLGIHFVTKLGLLFVLVVFLTLLMFYAGLILSPLSCGLDARITGLSWDTLVNNWGPQWREHVPMSEPDPIVNQGYSDPLHIGSMLAVFFPCFTGILSGANRADVLRDPPRDIRNGTFAAIIFSLLMYSSFMILWGAVAESCYLKGFSELECGDQGRPMTTIDGLIHNNSLLRRLAGGVEAAADVVGDIAWAPEQFPKAAFVGIIASSISQALQCFIVAPRLMQSIAKDEVIPFLKPIAILNRSGEPARAMFLTWCIAAPITLIGSVDAVAPLLSMCFLVAYACLNFCSGMLTLLRPATWRPTGITLARWRAVYILAGVFGFFVCLTIMFWIDIFYAAGVILLALFLYFVIDAFGARAEWGSGLDGIKYQLALTALESLGDNIDHKVNWRPQMLILYSIRVEDELSGIPHHEILQFYQHLRKGKGMCVVAAVLVGDRTDPHTLHKAQTEKKLIKSIMDQEGIRGFSSVVVAPEWGEGAEYIIQLVGLGGLVPNCILMSWPEEWSKSRAGRKYAISFVSVIQTALSEEKSVLAVKGLELMPTDRDQCSGTLDIWWIIHDGGLLILMSWLLQQHKVWRSTHLRVFTITESVQPEMAEMAGKRLTDLLRRKKLLDVEVEVVVLQDELIEPYTFDWSLRVEERHRYIQALNLKRGSTTMPMELDELFEDGSPDHSSSKAPDADDFGGFAAELKRTQTKEAIHPSMHDRLRTWDALKKSNDQITKTDKDHLKQYLKRRMSLNYEHMQTGEGAGRAGAITSPTAGVLFECAMKLESKNNYNESNEQRIMHPSASRDSLDSAQSDDYNSPTHTDKLYSLPEGSSVSPSVSASHTNSPGSTRRSRKPAKSDKFELLNQIILERSAGADLVMLNLPDVWGTTDSDCLQYMAYCECLTKNLPRVLFIHSTGHEVFDLDF